MGKQKRSENTYQKINTLFKRDANNIVMQYDEFVDPAFTYLRSLPWDATTKIDGTNIRLEVTHSVLDAECMDDGLTIPKSIEWELTFKGKTDNANIPKPLMKYLTETFTEDKVFNALGIKKIMNESDWVDKGWIVSKDEPLPDYTKIPKRYTLYGEGYGAGIQKCGGRYIKNGVSFIGFDVKVDDMYLLRPNMVEIFQKMNCPTTHYHGQMTIDEALDIVRKGFIDEIAEDRTFIAEGLVLSSPIGLKNRRGERLVVKIKYCDFEKYRNAYGTDDPVEQPINTEYNN